jgi:hypothetical protein
MLYLCFAPASPLLICVTAVILLCLQQREGLRREGEWKHDVLQQRAAGEAPLHEPPHACLLMHVGAAQASTRGPQERPMRPLVSRAEQVREMHAARMMPAYPI